MAASAENSAFPALSWWKAGAISGTQVIGSYAIFHLVDHWKPLSGPVRAISYVCFHGACIRTQPYIWAGLRAVWTEIIRDGPTVRKMGWSMVTALHDQAWAIAAYLAPVAIGILPTQTGRRYLLGAAVFALKWVWAETIPMVLVGCWKLDPTSWVLASSAIYFRYDWRFVGLAFLRKMLPTACKVSIMGPYPEEHKPRYEYQPITAPNTVRLLKIEPRLFRLRCSLVEHHLDAKDAAPFDAISYRWGASSEKTKVLDFGGKILPIPASAHEIIWNRASLWRTRLMWIDAICIDQEDQNDKNQQVGLMRDIYNKADRTIVWLGEAPDVVLAFNFLNEMLVQINLSKDNLELATMGLKRINDANPKWAALKRMLENPYWSRVWIVQEIVASRKVHIRYGGLWFDWDLFAPIVKELYTDSSSGLLQKLDLAEGMATPPFLAVHRIHSIESMRADYQTGVRWALAPVLINFAVSQSTLDKDHIFAFQGISSAVEDGALTPDYGKPALDIFREAVLYSLHRSRFMILSMAGMSHTRASVPDWPSWVPDFQAVSGLEPQLATALHTYAPYRASGICWPIVFAPEGSNEVTIRGFVVDEIVALTQLPPPDRSLWRGFGEVHSEDEKASVTMVLQDVGRFREAQELVESRLPPTYFNGQTRWDAFWRTYLGNKSTTSYPAEDDYGDRLRGFMDTQERCGTALLEGGNYEAVIGRYSPNLAEMMKSMQENMIHPDATAEDTLDCLDQILGLTEFGISARDLVPVELIGDRKRIFEELASAVNLPYWACRELRAELSKDSKTTSPHANEEPKPSSKALEELLMRVYNFQDFDEKTADKVLRRVILALAFIVGDGHLKLSKEQCHNLRQAALGDRKVTDAANTSHIGLLVGCTMGQRRVAVTRKGFLALAPKDAREGDLVSIFAGGKVPYVLRRAAGQGAGTEKYRLVGEGYLHGFMDGEIWASQVGLQEIVLV